MGNKGKRRSQTLSQHRGTAWNFLPAQVETLMSERQKKTRKGSFLFDTKYAKQAKYSIFTKAVNVIELKYHS